MVRQSGFDPFRSSGRQVLFADFYFLMELRGFALTFAVCERAALIRGFQNYTVGLFSGTGKGRDGHEGIAALRDHRRRDGGAVLRFGFDANSDACVSSRPFRGLPFRPTS
jgi:hypothetical protein